MENQEESPKKLKKGIINPKIVRMASFLIITLSLIGCTVLSVLAIWDYTKSDAVWKAIATFLIVIVATGIFTYTNERLG